MSKNQLLLKKPAAFWSAKWREALPGGNGVYGIGVYGGISKETVLLNHGDLWADLVRPPLPNISDRLPVVRSLLEQGDYLEAQDVMTRALTDRGYQPKIAWPLPLGDLTVFTPVVKGFRHYRRSLDMETGEIEVRWEDQGLLCRKAFVSRADKVIVMELSAAEGRTLEGVTLGLNIHDPDNATKPFGAAPVRLPEDVEVSAGGGVIRYAARYDHSGDFGAVAKIICPEQRALENGSVCLGAAEKALVLLRLFVNENRGPAWQRETEFLNGLTPDYSLLLERHAALHRPLFLSSRFTVEDGADKGLELSNQQLLAEAFDGNVTTGYIEKLWAYGRYLLISASGDAGLPCPLLGLWHGDYKAMWTFNMLNENLQMIYWPALSGNLPQAHLAVFDYFESMMEDFRENARKLFGCRGIYIPAVNTPHVGTIQCISRHILCWTAGAGWLGQHYYRYYQYTGDLDFLKNRALPFLREVALFYEDFFTLGEDEFYRSSPSVSPENSPKNWQGDPKMPYPEVTVNATMDFAVAKELLTNLLEGARLTGFHPEDWAKWEEMLRHIPPYQINEDGAVREWMDLRLEDHYTHRHQSHLYPVFPGNEVTREKDPQLFEAFVTAVKKRLRVGIQAQTSWSFAHMACVYARMGEGELALECLHNLMRACVMDNFFTVHNDWRCSGIGMDMPRAPFQIDANMGFTAAVNDMLLLSDRGSLRIFPALPAAWKQGAMGGIAAQGGILADLRWRDSGKSASVTLVAKAGTKVRVYFPGALRQVLADGKPAAFIGDHIPEVVLRPGVPLTLEVQL